MDEGDGRREGVSNERGRVAWILGFEGSKARDEHFDLVWTSFF